MLAPELAALLVVMAFVLLVFAVLGSVRRTEHIARSIGARMFG